MLHTHTQKGHHMKEEQLQQLREQLPRWKHAYGPQLKVDDWIAQGMPCIWEKYEERGTVETFVDTEYGLLCAFVDGGLVAWGKNQLIFGEYVLLDKEYYGTPTGLYKRVE